MFNQKNITQSLSKLVEIYSNNYFNIKPYIFSMPDICTSVISHIETVFEYEVDTEDLTYRGKDLFNQRACKLFEKLISSTTGQLTINRFFELWFLEDMTFAVVENINTVKRKQYSSDYRAIRTIVGSIEDIPFNPSEILEQLSEMCYDIFDKKIIYAM